MRTLLILFLLNSWSSYSCDCMDSPGFLEVGEKTSLVGKFKVIDTVHSGYKDNLKYIDLEALEIYKGYDWRKRIRLQAGSNAECRNNLQYFKKGETYLLAINMAGISPRKLSDVTGQYHMPICGQYSLDYNVINNQGFGRNDTISVASIEAHFKESNKHYIRNYNLKAPGSVLYVGLENEVQLDAESLKQGYQLMNAELTLQLTDSNSYRIVPTETGTSIIYIQDSNNITADSVVFDIVKNTKPTIFVLDERNNGIFERQATSFRIDYSWRNLYDGAFRITSFTLKINDVVYEGTGTKFSEELLEIIQNSRLGAPIEISCKTIDRAGASYDLKSIFYLSL